MEVKRTVMILGAIFLLSGLIFGVSQISSLKEMKKDVAYWKQAAKEASDNYLIEDRYDSLKATYKSDLSLTILVTIAGIISGLLFLALSTIIDLLEKLHKKDYTFTTQNNQSTQPPI